MFQPSGKFNKTTKQVPESFKEVKEGYASIIFKNSNEVFYNNVQINNRDLSTLVISEFIKDYKNQIKGKKGKINENKPVRILEALSASGLRSIRYWKEIEGITEIITNDLSPTAFTSIKRNVDFNEICSKTQVIPNCADANVLMDECAAKKKLFTVIDLDPYGSSIPFLYSSLKAIENGGLMCITCTDMPVLTGSNANTCFSRYGYYPVKEKYCHEFGIRTLLASVQNFASKMKKIVVPLVSCFIDFYVRIFVRVFNSPKDANTAYTKYGYIFQCTGCQFMKTVPLSKEDQKNTPFPNPICDECDSKLKFGGPIWTAPMHDVGFVKKLLGRLNEKKKFFKAYRRINGLLSVISNELQVPLFYHLPSFCQDFKCSQPKFDVFKFALINAGYKVSDTHVKTCSIKTNAPSKVLMDIFRVYVKNLGEKNYGKIENKPEIAQRILKKKVITKVDFTVHDPNLVKRKVKAFFPNPEKGWGPKKMAHSKKDNEEDDEKTIGKKRERGDEVFNDKEGKEKEPPTKKTKQDN